MKYAVFSDIHSNLEGLRAVLREAEVWGAEALFCCGDIVGYNADPDACVRTVRETGVRCIKGNHERGLEDLGKGKVPNMNPVAMEALVYTDRVLSAENREWLLSLPDSMEINRSFLLFHGSPSHPDDYIFDTFEAAYAFKSLVLEYTPPSNRLCFIGHTHVCAAYTFHPEEKRVESARVKDGSVFRLNDSSLYMFNVGSCGQYRGGLPVATLVLYDEEKRELRFRFLRYDLEAAREKILRAGLPPYLAQRLALGR